MSNTTDIEEEVDDILKQTWNIRQGTVVPIAEDVALKDGGVEIEVTMLYADLADSTKLATYNRKMAAKIFKSFLKCCAKIIRLRNGHIRSFDGDRVMGVFIGDAKNSNAAKCALNINYAFLKIIKPKLQAKYECLRDGTFELAHCVGVDTSTVLVVRSGIVNFNDLVWVGKAPNFAAKLSNIRNSPFNTYITNNVYDVLNDESKYASEKDMWQVASITNLGTCYKSNWHWQP